VRRSLRRLLKKLSFINDKIALFDLPALEIDTEVDGLLVIRGVTISLSSLTIIAHGVEVGIKLSDDTELALSCENVTIPLFRSIEVDDCYVAFKGGKYEMTFASVAEKIDETVGKIVEDTPLLQAAAEHGVQARPQLVTMTSKFTAGETLTDSSAQKGFDSIKRLSPDERLASKQYDQMISWIRDTNVIAECRKKVLEQAEKAKHDGQEMSYDCSKIQDLRAAICSQIHNQPSVPHPPKNSIRVTTLQNLLSPRMRTLVHKMPMLLRLLLSPLSHFHPIRIKSITAVGSGKWMSYMLQTKFFKSYSQDNAELRRLEERIFAWLSDANFAIELAGITGLAQVPLLSAFDVISQLGIDDVIAYRTLPTEYDLKQVVRLGGADAAFSIPSFLLPHHEHLLPPIPDKKMKEEIQIQVEDADGIPATVQKEKELEQADKDEATVGISVHARLPACFDQELLNFIAALVKASKVMELEKAPSAMEDRDEGFRNFARAVNKTMKDGVKKTMVDGIVNDRLIAKLVGKVTAKLEEIVGELGYSGEIPVALKPYRLPDGHPEKLKILA
jgi:hypothetical protein